MKSQYIIILTIIIIIIASMLLLAQIEDNQRTNNQNFWSIYFIDPLGSNNGFVIDNKTPNTQTFHYDVLVNNSSIHSGNIEIEKNDRKLIELTEQNNLSPIEIIVTNTDKTKTIERK